MASYSEQNAVHYSDALAQFCQRLQISIDLIASAIAQPFDDKDPIHDVGQPTLDILLSSDPQEAAQLACEKISAFRFSEVPHCWVRLFEDAQLHIIAGFTSPLVNQANDDSESEQSQHTPENGVVIFKAKGLFQRIISHIDMAWVKSQGLGRGDLIRQTLNILDGFQVQDSETDSVENNDSFDEDDLEEFMGSPDADVEGDPTFKSSKVPFPEIILYQLMNILPDCFSYLTENALTNRHPVIKQPVHECHHDSNAGPFQHAFHERLFLYKKPIVIRHGVAEWPAIKLWKDPNTWLRRTHGGHRLIPVEVGQKYTDKNWEQKLMKFHDFLTEFMIDPQETATIGHGSGKAASPKIGYFAQHEFLRQMPGFYQDIMTPDYVFADPQKPPEPLANAFSTVGDFTAARKRKRSLSSECSESFKAGPLHIHAPVDGEEQRTGDKLYNSEGETEEEPTPPDNEDLKIQIWLGPAGTVSPAHIDLSHNLFCQVVGRKYFRLFAPQEKDRLYPSDMWNTSQVDIGLEIEWSDEDSSDRDERRRLREEQRRQFTNFKGAKYMECVLEPGDCLFIPSGWWHYVQSLDISASVSFWWPPLRNSPVND